MRNLAQPQALRRALQPQDLGLPGSAQCRRRTCRARAPPARQPARIAIDQIDEFLVQHGAEAQVADSHALDRVAELIRRLPALDAQLILLWLEGETGQDIAEVTGLSPGAVTTRLHRIRAQLARHFELPATASGQDEGDQR